MRPALGWDIGGANLKAALVTEELLASVERPFALWRDPRCLPDALGDIAAEIGAGDAPMALTMTAELADCFSTLAEGVVFVLDAFQKAFPGRDPRVFDLDGRFLTLEEARASPLSVAAANWVATATVAARAYPDALLVDVGTTTTDIVPIVRGRVAAEGRTDTERLASGELVYTGITRTPVAAIVRSVPLGGRPCRVAAEQFAIAADVCLWLGLIGEDDYRTDTPDGRGRSRAEAGARIARMVCGDAHSVSEEQITAIARHVVETQTRRIAAAIRQVRRRLGPAAPQLALIAGSGSFLAASAATRAGLPVQAPAETFSPEASRIAPAYAVARLLLSR